MAVPPIVLSIAGYDPSSGAGITADIKTAAAHGCYAATCITALTIQSTQGVFAVRLLDPEWVVRTIAALAEDLEIAAVRLGMLGSGEVASAVAECLKARRLPNIVLDPVLRSSSGVGLLDEAGQEALRTQLLPLCDVVTPNVDEAAVLVGCEPIPPQASWEIALPHVRRMAAGLHHLGAKAVVITGGHLREPSDFLSYRCYEKLGSCNEEVMAGERVESRSTHGTGCAYAMALTCQLARGQELPEAVRGAKEYVRRAILSAYSVGRGVGPVNHLV